MGSWGPGLFENDAALDLVGDVLEVAESEIKAFCTAEDPDVEGFQEILAAVAIHLVLCEKCEATAPELELSQRLREKVLSLYDQQIDELQPNEDYKRARRAVIAEALNRYVEAASDAL